MRPYLFQTGFAVMVLSFFNSPAATIHYVNANGTNPVIPYTSWATAATNIQDAVGTANLGDTILVTNGIYQYGGSLTLGSSNRVYVELQNVTVQSVNGPAVTIIKGSPGTTNGVGAVRGVYLAGNSTLSGFTVTNGATFISDNYGGGGIYCQTTAAIVTNCIITRNASGRGGGVYSGTLNHCVIWQNTAISGGGTYVSQLHNCLVVRNTATYGGGGYGGIYANCTIVTNTASNSGGGVYAGSGATLNNSIIYFNAAPVNPNLWGAKYNYSCTIPSLFGDGNITNVPAFVNLAAGDFHLSPGSPCINAGDNSFITNDTDLDGNARIVGGTVDMGAYEFQGNIRYVSLNSTNPISPYSDWSIAATNIQDAVDAASAGDTVLVTNGIYASGGRKWYDSGTNRVTVTNSIVLRSVNGPYVTVIQGRQASGTNAVRCVLLRADAMLTGFTLTNGEGGIGNYPDGGGVYCESPDVVVSNCVMTGNLARLGGGVFRGTVLNCVLEDNTATESGGGAYNAALVNCLLTRNSAGGGGSAGNGGGAAYSSLTNCTLTGNWAGRGGGVAFGTADNCILYYNSFTSGGSAPNYIGATLNYCCSMPLPGSGFGNIINQPFFVDLANNNFHLQSNSPCINSGNNAYVTSTTDYDGNPRIAGGTVDIGAYEYPTPTSVLSYAWAQQYGLPTDGTADYADPDGDGMNCYQEWIARTIPTSPLSVLKMLNPAPAINSNGVVVSWQSVSNVVYFLQRSTNLGGQPAFLTIQDNVVGQDGTASCTDTNAVGAGPFFYRVGVQQ